MSGDESPSPGVGDEVDLRPWAAYVLGHHPFAVVMGRGHFRIDDCEYSPSPALSSWEQYRQILREIESALLTLARRGHLNTFFTIAFVQYHGDIEQFVKARQAEPGGGESPGGRTGGEAYPDTWWDLALLSRVLLPETDEHSVWRDFGKAVGESQLWLKDEANSDVLRLGTLRSLVGELETFDQYPFLGEVARQLARFDRDERPSSDEPGTDLTARNREALDHIDAYVQHALYRWVPPEPLLILDRDRLIFFEKEFKVRKLPSEAVAMLWVLADHVGEEVPRRQIKDEGNLTRDPADQRSTATRLRKILSTAIEAYYSKRLLKLPDEASHCFILGDRGGLLEPGPYQLKLPRGCVRVIGNKPEWMISHKMKQQSNG